jgi:zinc/manganese transport system substrate-binding protein
MRVLSFFIALLTLTQAHAERLPVVASFSILGDFVQQVGGDKVAVTTLVGPNGDAHVYQPSPQDAKALAGARVLVLNGLGFEGWMDRLTHASAYRGTQVIASAGITTRQTHPGQADPHAWQNPTLVRSYIANIEHGLSSTDPANAPYYHQRAQAYLDQLTMFEHWADTQVATVPAAQRRVITSHDAYAYLGDRFGIRFMAAQGIGTDSEASAKDLGNLIRQIRQEHIRALFIENISNPRLLQQISSETGTKPGPELYSDALSKPGGPATDYLSMMRYNIATLVAGMKQNQ